MKLQSINRYEAYKDSGVEGLGEVPTHWEIKHLKNLAEIKGGKDSKVVELEEGGYPVYGSGGVFGRASQYLHKKPSVLLGRKGTVDKPLFVTEPFWSVDTMFYTDIKNNVDPKFFYYQCLTIKFGLYQYGSAVPSMAQNVLSKILFATPDYSEQQAIANYLDTQTAQIDRKIDLLSHKATQYGKLKQSLINETVTRGLDKTVAMKDSGVEWIGEVPAHWEKGRIKDFVNTNALTKVPSGLLPDSLIEFIPMSNVDDIAGKIKEYNFVPLKEVSSGYTKFKNRDVIFAKITPCMENGNCAIVSGLTQDICFGSTEFIVFRVYKKLTEKYLHYYLHNDLFRRNAEPFMRGTAGQKRISTHFMATHFIGLPPLEEQIAINNYLDSKTAHIDRIIVTINTQIDKLKELRKALINDVVTGKIKVA